MSMDSLPPPGWYRDPDQGDQERYFDGSSWTDHRRMAEAAVSTATPDVPMTHTHAPSRAVSEPVSVPSPAEVVYDSTESVKATWIYPLFLAVGCTMAASWMPPLFISAILAAISAYFGLMAQRGVTRGDLQGAKAHAVKSRRFRRYTHISLPITFILGVFFFLLGLALLLG
jgi:hypothetical protein